MLSEMNCKAYATESPEFVLLCNIKTISLKVIEGKNTLERFK